MGIDITGMGFVAKLFAAYLYCLVTGAWTYYTAKPLSPGFRRTLLALPVVIGNLLLTEILWDYRKEPVVITPFGGVFSLSAFKVLALCLNRGPLTLDLDFLQFTTTLHVPIIPNRVFKVSGGMKKAGTDSAWHLLNSYFRNMGFAILVAVVNIALIDYLPIHVRYWLYTLTTACFLESILNGMGAIASGAANLEVAPTFDKPWLSSSFADFWARRWNLTTTYMMRVLVYEPVIEGRLTAQPTGKPPGPSAEYVKVSQFRRYIALQATFLFSGLWHVLIFWYNTHTVSWRWFSFFAMQAPILIMERYLIKWARSRRFMLPTWASIIIANYLLIVVSTPVFFRPVDDSGMSQRIFESLKPAFARFATTPGSFSNVQ